VYMHLKKTIVALVVAVLLISSFPTIVFAASPDNPVPVSDLSQEQILVKFKPDVTLPEAAEIHRQLGGQVKETIPDIGVQVVKVPKGQAMAKVKAYSANAKVAYAEPDFVVQALADPDDPGFVNQWGMVKVRAPLAWDVTTGSPSINIAILDTGVDLDHPDLAAKIVKNINFSSSATVDDVYGHGTHVAGIAAAMTNNGMGVAGLGYSATIMNVKVLADNGQGYWSGVAQGIIWAADNGAEIINMSLGGSSGSSTVESAINYAWNKGVVIVAAAGNDGDSAPEYPAYYANCMAVAATDSADRLTDWSNRGGWVDVAAPGNSVYSTLKDGSYGYKSGTSMASPHVAGLAALVFTVVTDSNGNGRLNDEVRARIQATCDDIGVSGIGSGRIQAYKAVTGTTTPPPWTGSIVGKVTDAAHGSPIAGALMRCDGTWHEWVVTNSKGEFAFTYLLPGSYKIVASATGYVGVAQVVEVKEGQASRADFALVTSTPTSGSITGKVTDAATGLPIVGATVTDGARTALSDTNGQYIISDVPQGTYTVSASAIGYSASSQAVSVVAGQTITANFALAKLPSPGSIAGKITDSAAGSPIPEATVSDGARTALSDTNGQYVISDVPEGNYTVTASATGYSTSSQAVSAVAGQTATANFALAKLPSPGSIAGKITDSADGSPIPGATVSDGVSMASTDTNGQFLISDVSEGAYTVAASAAGYSASSQAVSVVAGRSTTADFVLTRLAPSAPNKMWVDSITFGVTGKNLRLSLNVVSENGAVCGAQVAVQLTNGVQNWNFSGTTDTAGLVNFTVTKAPAGNYAVSVAGVTVAGYTWDTTQGVLSATYTAKSGGGKK
jgi:thermitase